MITPDQHFYFAAHVILCLCWSSLCCGRFDLIFLCVFGCCVFVVDKKNDRDERDALLVFVSARSSICKHIINTTNEKD